MLVIHETGHKFGTGYWLLNSKLATKLQRKGALLAEDGDSVAIGRDEGDSIDDAELFLLLAVDG